MAIIINRMLRVIPKNNKSILGFDCQAMAQELVETGGELWEKIIYYINEEENCLDIKFKSRKGKGNLSIEDRPEDFDIWEIRNYEGGMDYIFCNNYAIYDLPRGERKNLYRFDQISLIGNHAQLMEDFYPQFFNLKSGLNSCRLKNKIGDATGDEVVFQMDGIYTAGTIYNVGETYSDLAEKVSKHIFFKPCMVSYWEAEFLLLSSDDLYEMRNLFLSLIQSQFRNFKWNKDNLNEIRFYNKGRVVKKVVITDTHWQYYNAEYFDNSVENNWLDYAALWKRDLIW